MELVNPCLIWYSQRFSCTVLLPGMRVYVFVWFPYDLGILERFQNIVNMN